MNEHVFKVLEFDKVCAFLESFAQSEGGRRLCRMSQPSTDPSNIRRLQQETTELKTEIEDSGQLALGSVHDIISDVQHTRIDNVYLDQQQLLRITETLETAEDIKVCFNGLQEKAPALFQLTEPLVSVHSLSESIRSCISLRGDILDKASKELLELRCQIRALRASIIRNLEKYLHDVDLNFAVQDDFITQRNNRYVIPIRSDRKTAIPGVVHDQSQSKATFFVEPLEILELNNTLQLTQGEALQEEIRILTKLTNLVRLQKNAILNNISILEQLDAVHARACFSKALTAQPATLCNDGTILLKKCRHPILSARFLDVPAATNPDREEKPPTGTWVFDQTEVVEIDISKINTVNTLVITGANAGGKTVALKTLGLFVLMHQSGMHLPVSSGSELSYYESLFADIGDEQNIEANLSTFTAHMERIKTVVMSATSRSLVLLDELGSGTDPAEGGSLATAILEHLRTLGCTTLVTSHLNMLKTYAHTHADAENVSVDFDPHTHRPLYSLIYGLPGFSNALSIARNIGIPESILQIADTYMGQSDRQVTDLMHTLEGSQHMLFEKHARLDEQHENNTVLISTCRHLLETMKNRRENILKNFEKKSRALIRDSENRLRSIIKENRKQRNSHGSDTLKQMKEVKQKLYHHFQESTPKPETLDHVEIGQRVTVISLKKSGTVSAVDTIARRAEINIGNIRVKAGFNELTTPGQQKGEIQKPALPRTPVSTSEPDFEKQLNVIGLRVNDALPLIDKNIDKALVQGADMLEIIHGRGTGRLMRAIHDHLQDHAQVSRIISDSDQPGNSGATRIELK